MNTSQQPRFVLLTMSLLALSGCGMAGTGAPSSSSLSMHETSMHEASMHEASVHQPTSAKVTSAEADVAGSTLTTDGGVVSADLSGLDSLQARLHVIQAINAVPWSRGSIAVLDIGKDVSHRSVATVTGMLRNAALPVHVTISNTSGDAAEGESSADASEQMLLNLYPAPDELASCRRQRSLRPVWWSSDATGPQFGCATRYNDRLQGVTTPQTGLSDETGVMATSAASRYQKGQVMPLRETSLVVGGQ